MKATMLDGPGDVRVENRPHPMILKPTDPSSASSAACARGAPEPSTAPELPASDKETLSGWQDLNSRPFDPQTSAARPSTSTDVRFPL
jgi:hypothetical protein